MFVTGARHLASSVKLLLGSGKTHVPHDLPPHLKQYADDRSREIHEVIRRLAAEGERSAVIVGMAFLDARLEELLRKVLPNNASGNSDGLFDPDRPLGSSSAKAELAWRLGLIGDDVAGCMKALRKIRNHFAHNIETASLSEGPQADQLKHAASLASKSSVWEAFKFARSLAGKHSDLESLEDVLVCTLILLESAIHYAQPLKVEYRNTFASTNTGPA